MTERNGAGIASFGGKLTIQNSEIANNDSDADGGGISAAGNVVISNSTIPGNDARFSGDEIGMTEGSAQLLSVTIADNVANSDGESGIGGGCPPFFNGEATLANSIVAGNHVVVLGNQDANDIEGNVGGSFNLVGDPNSSGGLTYDVDGNIIGQNDGNAGRELFDSTTVFEPLEFNVGPTRTHALLYSGPAVDAGNLMNLTVLISVGAEAVAAGQPVMAPHLCAAGLQVFTDFQEVATYILY